MAKRAAKSRLTDALARAAQADPEKAARGGDTFLWCGSLSGFGLKITPHGAKSWIFQYRNADGVSRRLTLGSVAKLSASAARDEAEKALGQVRNRHDPQGAKVAERKAATIGEYADAWIAAVALRVAHNELAPTTHADYERKVRVHIKPAFGGLKPAEMSAEKVQAWRTAALLAASKPKQVGEGPRLGTEGVKAVLRVLSAFCSHLVKEKVLTANPAADLQQFSTRERQRFLSRDEAARLGAALDRARAGQPHWVAAVEMMLLTGMRKSEVLGLRWSDVHAEDGRIVVATHKTSRRTGAKTVAITAPVADILARAQEWRIAGNEHVFPTVLHRSLAVVRGARTVTVEEMRGAMTPGGLKRFWMKIRKEAGLAGGDALRLHDLRHSWGATAASSGVSLPMIAANLGHRSLAATKRYSHIADEAAARTAEQVSKLMREKLGAGASGQVVDLHQARPLNGRK